MSALAISSRSHWGGPAAPFGSIYSPAMVAVTVHHTFSPALPASATVAQERAAMLGMHRDHINRNGWAGIGYHFVIFQSGRVYEGRGWGRTGAHAGSADGNRTLGVVFTINGETTAPSAAALNALGQLRDLGVREGRLTRGHALKLHMDWKATSCPGRKVVEALRELPAPSRRVAGVVLSRGDRGEKVELLQDLLVATGYMTAAQKATGPGVFGPQTEAAFRTFREAHSDV
ncbi:MAG TPA: N-acetylmuramoyl-L-alanine amidase [Longimicrobiales bacterium]|nr:N-acetylmuramoyl-L-alanine amidase [Longimicrobiales bacterium]